MLRASRNIIGLLTDRVSACAAVRLQQCRQSSQRADNNSNADKEVAFANVSEFFKKAENEIRSANEQKAQAVLAAQSGAKATAGKQSQKSFEELLRGSALMQLADVNGRHVIGTVFDIVADDLYIDFGMKFHCVVKRPKQAKPQ